MRIRILWMERFYGVIEYANRSLEADRKNIFLLAMSTADLVYSASYRKLN